MTSNPAEEGDMQIPAEQAGRPASASPPGKQRISVLAETDVTLRKQYAEALRQAGFAVEARESGIEAVVAAREFQPDLIVLGSQLRDVPAREAIDWLKANAMLEATPIVVLGGSLADEVVFARKKQRVDVVLKPLTADKIQHAITAHRPTSKTVQ